MKLARFRIAEQFVPVLYTAGGEAVDCRELKIDWGSYFFLKWGIARLEGWYTQRSKHRLLRTEGFTFGPAVMRPPNLFRLSSVQKNDEEDNSECIPTAGWQGPGGPLKAIREGRSTSVRTSIELGYVVGRGGFRIRDAGADRGGLILLSHVELCAEDSTQQCRWPYHTGVGPYLLTPDEFTANEGLEARITLNDAEIFCASEKQLLRTPIEALRAISRRTRLLPGDVISIGFTSDSAAPVNHIDKGDTFAFSLGRLGFLKMRVA